MFLIQSKTTGTENNNQTTVKMLFFEDSIEILMEMQVTLQVFRVRPSRNIQGH